MRLLRRILLALVGIGVATVAWALPYGPLFPWSPWKPGYQSRALVQTTIVWPEGQTPPPSFLAADSFLEDASRFHGLPIERHLTVILCAGWSDFFRFLPTLRSKAVGGATLQTGNAIYITPKIAEKQLDTAEFLRHEISHAILHQNTPLWKTVAQQRHSWIYEGVPVWFGHQRSYYTRQELVDAARSTDLRPLFREGGLGENPNMRLAYTAWATFLDTLDREHGHAKFLQLLQAFRDSPAAIEASFAAIYGTRLESAVAAFQAGLR